MKEFCLVPRKVAEKYLFKETATEENTNDNKVGSGNKEERRKKHDIQKGGHVFLKKKKKAITSNREIIKKVKKTNSPSKSNPSLEHLIRIKFKLARHREYASSLLTYFTDKTGLEWDEEGNLSTPFGGYNIIDIIKDLVQGRNRLPKSRASNYRLLLDHVTMPSEYIENTKARTQLYGGRIDWESYT